MPRLGEIIGKPGAVQLDCDVDYEFADEVLGPEYNDCKWQVEPDVIQAVMNCALTREKVVLSRNMDDARHEHPWRVTRFDSETLEPIGHSYGMSPADALSRFKWWDKCELLSVRRRTKPLGSLPKTGRIPLKIRAGFTFDREPRVWAHEKESGEEVGYVFGMSCAVGEYAAVRDAEIDPKWRGKGVYPSMLKALRDIAQQNGCAGVVSRASGRIKDMSTKSWKKFAAREPRVREEAGDYYLSALPKTGRISLATARKALKLLPPGRRACKITAANLREGMEVEREHRDVTRGGMKATAKIAAAHLCERPDYYKRLKRFVEK